MRQRFAFSVPLLCALIAGPALAGTFDEATGKLVLDPQSVSWDVDHLATAPSDLSPVFNDADGWTRATQRFLPEEDCIEGLGCLAFGGDLGEILFDLRGLASRLEGRRVEVRFWQRAAGTRASAEISWYSGDLDDAMENGNWWSLHGMGTVVLLPTGRATDDGWIELSSGPFDFMLGGELPATYLSITDPHAAGSRWDRTILYDPDLRVHLDAVEVIDLGPARTPDAACTLATEETACGEGGVCRYGRCVDAVPVLGPSFASDAVRRDYLRRRAFEISLFDGSRRAGEAMPALEEVFGGLEEQPDAARIWPAVDQAFQSLYDGHASAPQVPYLYAPGTGACLDLGEADLLPDGGLAPLVFSVDGDHPIGSQLMPGDVLTAVDGMPVAEWRRLARRLLDYPGDPEGLEVMTTGQLLGAAMETGATVTFTRCPALDAAGTGCEGELQTIELDLAALGGAPLWENAPPRWHYYQDACDHRFRRIPQVSDPAGYATASSTVEDGITWLLFNGFPDPSYGSGIDWADVFRTAFTSGPDRVIVDERTGYGGTAGAMTLSTSYFLASSEFDRMELAPQTDFDWGESLLSDLRSCYRSSNEFIPCGYFSVWRLEDYYNQYQGALADSRVALLVTSDVSGNDYFTRLMRFRTGPTRIFGPTVTWGAFGPIVSLPTHIGEAMGGSFQIQDTAFYGPGHGTAPWSTGYGVAPDVVVHQKQSDALRGVDTLVEAARAWVLQ